MGNYGRRKGTAQTGQVQMKPQLIIGSAGDTAILGRCMVALLCSAKCPGKLIREQGVTVLATAKNGVNVTVWSGG